MRILLIEDDEALCVGIKVHLKKLGYEVEYCQDGQEGLDYIREKIYDLAIIDRMLPSLDGISITAKARQENIPIPIIMLTALSEIKNRVEGLEAGADDYLTKPFAMEELSARIKALARRPVNWDNSEKVSCGDLELDKVSHSLTGPEDVCMLSKKECSLAEVFMKNHNHILPRKMIFNKVWGMDHFVEEGNLDNYIYFLRRKLALSGSSMKIETVHGIGYILK